MSVFSKRGVDIFAPTDASGNLRKVVNGEVQVWSAEVERAIYYAMVSGNLSYATKADLDADLAHDDGTVAWVVADTEALNGIYVKTGASGTGSWTKERNLPKGPQGDIGGVAYRFDEGTDDADPGTGLIRANNADLSSATELYVSKSNRYGDDLSAFLATLAGSTSTHKGYLILTAPDSETQAAFNLTGMMDAAGYVKLAVEAQSGATSFSDSERLIFLFSRTGNAGDLNGVNPGPTGLALLEADTAAEADALLGDFPTKTDAAAYSPVPAPATVRTAGETSVSDGRFAVYSPVGSEPTHDAKFSMSLSGGGTQWYENVTNLHVERQAALTTDFIIASGSQGGGNRITLVDNDTDKELDRPTVWLERKTDGLFTQTIPNGANIIPVNMYARGEVTGPGPGEYAVSPNIMSFMRNSASNENDATAISGVVENSNSGNGLAAGVFGAAYVHNAAAGRTMGVDAHIYVNNPSAGSGPVDDPSSANWKTAIVANSVSSGADATSGLLIVAGGTYKFWNGILIGGTAFRVDGSNNGVAGTVGINMSSARPQIGIKFGGLGAGTHIFSTAALKMVSDGGPLILNPSLAGQPIVIGPADTSSFTGYGHELRPGGFYRVRRNSSTATDAVLAVYSDWGASNRNVAQLRANGDILNFNNSYGALSDARLKENISDARSYLDDLLRIRIRKYSMKEDNLPDPNMLGVLAQEVEEVFPGLVSEDEDGFKSVKYSIFVPMLISAVQALAKEKAA